MGEEKEEEEGMIGGFLQMVSEVVSDLQGS